MTFVVKAFNKGKYSDAFKWKLQNAMKKVQRTYKGIK